MVALVDISMLALFQKATPVHADTGSNWTGSYYSNPSLEGSPVFSRIDPALVFNWGPHSPGSGIGSQYWSARWLSVQYLNAGTYRFNIEADDGVRMFIDGQSILDAWHDEAPTTYVVNVQVAAGNHALQVDYYQATGDSSLSVSWDYLLAQSTAWLAQYFNNPNLDGTPVLTRYESSINYFWGTGSPDPAVPNTNFSARWTATLPFSAATYRFTLAGDDGVRLFIDNARVIDQWHPETLTAYSIDVPLAAGLHTLRVEYFQNADQAAVRFNYEVAVGPPPYPGTQSDQWYGEYFPNTNLQGTPSFVRQDGQSGINFNWSQAAPATNFPHEVFSVRWTRRIFFPGRPYAFYITVDDGARLFIDNNLIIDAWKVQPATTYARTADITEGYHVVRLEYFQDHADAVIRMTWDPPNSQNPPLPVNGAVQPPPSSAVTGSVTLASALNVRTGPGRNYDILTQLVRGDTFTVLARNADLSWVRIQNPNAAGWVSAFYISFPGGNPNGLPVEAPSAPPSPLPSGVRGRLYSDLRLRTGPSPSFPALTTLGWGTFVDIIGRNSSNTWYQVQYGGLTGWIYGPYVVIVSGSALNVPITG